MEVENGVPARVVAVAARFRETACASRTVPGKILYASGH
jgi:hypothetical protein